MKKFLQIFLFLLSGSLINDAVHAAERSVVVLFGDSITVGINSNYPGGTSNDYANGTTTRGCSTIYLTAILTNQNVIPPGGCKVGGQAPQFTVERKKRNALVVNWGEGGTNSQQGAQRISANLAKTKSDHDGGDYTVLLMYGTNDRGYGISSQTTNFNTRLLIDRARAQGYKPVIGTLIPRSDFNVSGYNSAILSAANAKSVPIVDHYSVFVGYPSYLTNLLDLEFFFGNPKRIHPKNRGYLLIAETWFDRYLKDAISPEYVDITPIITLLLDD